MDDDGSKPMRSEAKAMSGYELDVGRIKAAETVLVGIAGPGPRGLAETPKLLTASSCLVFDSKLSSEVQLIYPI